MLVLTVPSVVGVDCDGFIEKVDSDGSLKKGYTLLSSFWISENSFLLMEQILMSVDDTCQRHAEFHLIGCDAGH
jgi:hypothetical protein